MFDSAMQRAKALDESLETTGQLHGPLHGLPVSLKDQFDVRGVDSTLGFVSLCGKPAKRNSVLVDMLESLGAIVFCKTTLPMTIMVNSPCCDPRVSDH
jgi:amidase